MVSTFLFLLAVNHSANFKRLQENLNHVIIINELLPKFLDKKLGIYLVISQAISSGIISGNHQAFLQKFP